MQPVHLSASHQLVNLADTQSPPALSPGPSGDWMPKVRGRPADFPIMAYLFRLLFLFSFALDFICRSSFLSSSLDDSSSHGLKHSVSS